MSKSNILVRRDGALWSIRDLRLRVRIGNWPFLILGTLQPISQNAKKCWKSMEIDIPTHHQSPKKYVPLDILNMPIFYFGLPGNDCTKDKNQPKKSAAFGGRLLVLFWGLKYSHFLEVQNNKWAYWVYLMEHICPGSDYVLKYRFPMDSPDFLDFGWLAVGYPANCTSVAG